MQYALILKEANFFATRNRMAYAGLGKNQSAAVCKSLLDDQQFDQYREIKKDTRKLLENLDNGKS